MGCPAGKVVSLDQEAGKSFSYEEIKNAVETNKPAVLFLCQVCALSCWRTSWHRAGLLCCLPELHGEHARVSRELSIYGSASETHSLELSQPPAAHACAKTHRMCLPNMLHSTAQHCQGHALSLPTGQEQHDSAPHSVEISRKRSQRLAAQHSTAQHCQPRCKCASCRAGRERHESAPEPGGDSWKMSAGGAVQYCAAQHGTARSMQ